jgi:hypothetical protein
MEAKLSLSIRVGIYMSRALWHAFRVACVQHKTSASTEIQRLITQQLAAWHQAPQQKETDHV